MTMRPNLLFVLADQLRAASVPLYAAAYNGALPAPQIEMPNVDRLAAGGVTFTNAVSSNPLCTPYRSMLLTGRHPQTTGHLINFVRTRHTEISIADAFASQGYRTGWIGKWHLHTGSFPTINGRDYVPEGRDRLGFQFWRGYNFHTVYFDGSVNREDWHSERWEGYETQALNRYAFQFMDEAGNDPFCLFLSPHQPHYTPFEFAPQVYYERLPTTMKLPDNVPHQARGASLEMVRHYLAMTLALDDMLGELLDYLERTGKAENTLVVFTSDHGSQVGAHGVRPWEKRHPYRESTHVPCVMRLPGVLDGGVVCDTLTAPVDYFPSLCSLFDVPIPRTVEGVDLSGAWLGVPGAREQEALLTMNFSAQYDWFADGLEWRGVRAKRYNYARWLDGRTELYDLYEDPLEMHNLAGDARHAALVDRVEGLMRELQTKRGDKLVPCTQWSHWLDSQRRVVRNAYGPLGDPEGEPDWSLLS
jgi:arylsulfatase A-like enzyme